MIGRINLEKENKLFLSILFVIYLFLASDILSDPVIERWINWTWYRKQKYVFICIFTKRLINIRSYSFRIFKKDNERSRINYKTKIYKKIIVTIFYCIGNIWNLKIGYGCFLAIHHINFLYLALRRQSRKQMLHADICVHLSHFFLQASVYTV